VKDLIIVGYPKSGVTWLTRLIARIIDCPVAGFHNQPDNNEIAMEGKERRSVYRCYKAHQEFKNLGFDINDENKKVIYIIRDPRDIAVSGANQLKFYRADIFNSLLNIHPKIKSVLYHLTTTKAQKLDHMINLIFHGNPNIPWCWIPWAQHYRPYYQEGILFVRYEDLLDDTYKECRRILKYLGINSENEKVIRGIKEESFDVKKQYFIQLSDTRRARHMRVGKMGAWREELSHRNNQLFIENLGESLKRFSYKA